MVLRRRWGDSLMWNRDVMAIPLEDRSTGNDCNTICFNSAAPWCLSPRPLIVLFHWCTRCRDSLQIAHLESRRYGYFAFRSKTGQPSKLQSQEESQSFHFNCILRWRPPRRMIVQSRWCTRGGSSRKFRSKPPLTRPFYEG